MNNVDVRLIVVGAGELGGRVANRWVAEGGSCIAVTLTDARHPQLEHAGVCPVLAHGFLGFEPGDVCLFATPGSQTQKEVVQRLAHGTKPARSVFCSSTAVFRIADTRRKRNAEAAELAFQEWAGSSGVVLRLGGLYRDGRGPFSSLKKGRIPAPGPAERPMPLVHYEDAATAVWNALRLKQTDHWYTVATKPVPTRRDFYECAGLALGVTVPLTEGDFPPVDFELERSDVLLPDPTRPDWRAAVQ